MPVSCLTWKHESAGSIPAKGNFFRWHFWAFVQPNSLLSAQLMLSLTVGWPWVWIMHKLSTYFSVDLVQRYYSSALTTGDQLLAVLAKSWETSIDIFTVYRHLPRGIISLPAWQGVQIRLRKWFFILRPATKGSTHCRPGKKLRNLQHTYIHCIEAPTTGDQLLASQAKSSETCGNIIMYS